LRNRKYRAPFSEALLTATQEQESQTSDDDKEDAKMILPQASEDTDRSVCTVPEILYPKLTSHPASREEDDSDEEFEKSLSKLRACYQQKKAQSPGSNAVIDERDGLKLRIDQLKRRIHYLEENAEKDAKEIRRLKDETSVKSDLEKKLGDCESRSQYWCKRSKELKERVEGLEKGLENQTKGNGSSYCSVDVTLRLTQTYSALPSSLRWCLAAFRQASQCGEAFKKG
jgi:hypothetical protein